MVTDALLGTDDTKWMTPKMVKTSIEKDKVKVYTSGVWNVIEYSDGFAEFSTTITYSDCSWGNNRLLGESKIYVAHHSGNRLDLVPDLIFPKLFSQVLTFNYSFSSNDGKFENGFYNGDPLYFLFVPKPSLTGMDGFASLIRLSSAGPIRNERFSYEIHVSIFGKI